MALIAVMNNCAEPSASIRKSTDVVRLCGLCAFNTLNKSSYWKNAPLTEFRRCTAQGALWTSEVLFGATPDCCVWEPLHLLTRCVSNWLTYIHAPLSASAGEDLIELIERYCKDFNITSGLTIKTVIIILIKPHYKISLTLSLQMKLFFNSTAVDEICSFLSDLGVSDGMPEVEITARVLDDLGWFWAFIHSKDAKVDDIVADFTAHRTSLLLALAQTDIVFAPSWHYLTNHLWEDFVNWGPLYFLLGEGSEASHARDGRLKQLMLKGREADTDTWNSWSLLLRNLLSLHSLMRSGILSR